MIYIELTREEARTLHQILQSDLSDLHMEIAGTEQMDFREFLKEREVFLKGQTEKVAHHYGPLPQPPYAST